MTQREKDRTIRTLEVALDHILEAEDAGLNVTPACNIIRDLISQVRDK